MQKYHRAARAFKALLSHHINNNNNNNNNNDNNNNDNNNNNVGNDIFTVAAAVATSRFRMRCSLTST